MAEKQRTNVLTLKNKHTEFGALANVQLIYSNKTEDFMRYQGGKGFFLSPFLTITVLYY